MVIMVMNQVIVENYAEIIVAAFSEIVAVPTEVIQIKKCAIVLLVV